MGSLYRPTYRASDSTLKESAVIWLKYRDALGVLRREASGTVKEQEARRLLKQREGASVDGRVIIPRSDRVTVAELAEGRNVFHRRGKPIKSFRKSWTTACEAAGCPGRIPHDFRRTAVRNLERAGVPRSAAMRMVGHKTEAIYRRYAIVSDADLHEASAKLARLDAGQSSGQSAQKSSAP